MIVAVELAISGRSEYVITYEPCHHFGWFWRTVINGFYDGTIIVLPFYFGIIGFNHETFKNKCLSLQQERSAETEPKRLHLRH